MELQVIQKSICDLGRQFRHYEVCLLLSKELKPGSLNQIFLLAAMKEWKYEECILTFGQQAVENAPFAMKHLLSPSTYDKLCKEYRLLKQTPMKRRINDMLIPIEHNGEKFIPADKLVHEFPWLTIRFKTVDIDSIRPKVYLIGEGGREINHLDMWPYAVVLRLIEWGFEINT